MTTKVIEINGIKTEFETVNCVARVGDYVLVTRNDECGAYFVGDVFPVIMSDGPAFKDRDGTPRRWGAFSDTETLRPTGNVIIDGQRYRKVNRPAFKGELILVTNPIPADAEHFGYNVGSVLTAETDTYSGQVDATDGSVLNTKEYVVLEPLDDGETSPFIDVVSADHHRITALESEVATLKSRVATLESAASSGVVSLPTLSTPKSQQQRRDELIREAIDDYNELVAIGQDDRKYLPNRKSYFYGRWFDVEVTVNRELRAVRVEVYELSGFSPKPYKRIHSYPDAIYTAYAPVGEVFNEHLLKVIALRRALELEVPVKYTTYVPQPEGKRVGDVVEYDFGGDLGVQNRTLIPSMTSAQRNAAHVDSWVGQHGKLIDDSGRYAS